MLQDCWVIVFHRIINVTDVLAKVQHDLAAPILARAGSDVSHWFKQDAVGLVSVSNTCAPTGASYASKRPTNCSSKLI
jgi:hypothetical protein